MKRTTFALLAGLLLAAAGIHARAEVPAPAVPGPDIDLRVPDGLPTLPAGELPAGWPALPPAALPGWEVPPPARDWPAPPVGWPPPAEEEPEYRCMAIGCEAPGGRFGAPRVW